ncbi:MAG: amidohydrolase family protein [Planctomycetota bacterium]|nr:amidohydrolase family protein [Planctomycetota bacterium]
MAFGLAVALVALAAGPATVAGETLAIRGRIIHTMAGDPIPDGVVVVTDGRIVAVGPAATTAVPADARVLEAAVVTPGLIDAHCVVGLSGYLNQDQDQDQLDASEPVQPELRAVDAYNSRERLVEWVRGFGVTTLHTGHAPGALVSGQTMVVKTAATAGVLKPTAMVAVTLGDAGRAQGEKKAPGTRAKSVAMLRTELARGVEYRRKQADPDPEKRPALDLRLEALARIVAGEWPLLVTADRATDIEAALRVAEEFGIRIVLDSAAESHLLVDRIRAAGVPVILHPTMKRAGSGETENASFETAATLRQAGIPVALQSGYESYVPKTRVVLFEAGVASANGLTIPEALATITIDAARILGVADRIGSLEPGKDADLALFDGDPFEYTSHCTGVVIDGVVVANQPR